MRKINRIHLDYSIKTTTNNSTDKIREIAFKNFPHRCLFSLLLLFITGIAGIQAQPFYVKLSSATQIGFDIDHIQSITFPQSNIVINITDGSTSTYPLADVHYLSFSDYTTVFDLAADSKAANIQLYPNPVTNFLHLTFRSEKSGNVKLSVINLQGKVIQQQNIACNEGTNYTDISVAELKQGLYLLHFQNRKKSEAIKFMKN